MMIGRDFLREHAQSRFAPGFRDISEDLIKRPVLLDHINHVFENAWFAQFCRDRDWQFLWIPAPGFDDLDHLVDSGNLFDPVRPQAQLVGIQHLLEGDPLHGTEMIV